jgi:hypothetical protein
VGKLGILPAQRLVPLGWQATVRLV